MSVLSFLLITMLSAQLLAKEFNSSVSGYVFDKATKEPLVGVNVYISNTTWGSSTDKDGFYEITSLPPGIHELVVSMIGYKIKSRGLLLKRNDKKKINFMLKAIIYKTKAIEIVAADRADWYKNYDIFKKKFFGSSPFAKMCTIKNEDVLSFKKIAGELKADTKEPLVLINKAFGY